MACADAGYATSTALQTFEPEHIRNGGHVFVRRKKPGNIQSGYASANGALETSFANTKASLRLSSKPPELLIDLSLPEKRI
ncbi:MAG: hypothetical protein WAO08_01010 [Hyphomicrobiaceae bacterium]